MSIMSDLYLGIYTYNDKKDKQTYLEAIGSKENFDTAVDETTGVNNNIDCIENAENPLAKAFLPKAKDYQIEVCVEPEPQKCEEDAITAMMPIIADAIKLLEEQENNTFEYQPSSLNMKMVERKYKLRRTLEKNPNKHQNIVDFCHSISATPQSANSFKHIYAMKRSESDKPILMLFYNQSVNLDMGKDSMTAKIGFEDIRTITFHTYLDWYITKNSFVGDIRRSENLFSFDNIVIDVDNHSDDIEKRVLDKEIRKLIKCLKAENLDFPEFNAVYTGRGVQIWIGLVSFTARKDSMKRLYATFCEKLCGIVKEVVEDNGLRLQVDEGASKDMCRFVRLPYTTNTKAHKKATFKKLTDRRYTVDELCNRFDIKRASKDRKKEVATPKKRGINYNMDFSTLFIKRMNFIEKIVADCNGNCVGRRELLLHHYFNVCRQLFDDEKAREMTEQLNQQFSEPLQTSVLRAIFREKIYSYSSDTFLSSINATFEERQLYLMYTTGRQSKRDKAKKAKEERNQKIVELRANGCTQQQIADIVGCHVDTVSNVLKEYKPEIKQKTDNTDDTKKQKCRKPVQKDVKKSTIELYKQGYKQKEIAKKLGITESKVSDILKPYKKKISPRDCKIIELSKQGYKQQQIVDIVGCSERTVRNVLKAYKENKISVPVSEQDKPVDTLTSQRRQLLTDEKVSELLQAGFPESFIRYLKCEDIEKDKINDDS